jgi:hypothetical protein
MAERLLQDLNQLLSEIALLLVGQRVPDLLRSDSDQLDQLERTGNGSPGVGQIPGERKLMQGSALDW